MDLSVELATCIAIGTILSFVLVGGFTQSIARKGFFYMNQHFYNVGGKITSNTIKTGFALCFVVAVSLLVFNLLFEIFTFPMMLIINIFFVLLMSLWLSVTVMYTLRKELVFTGLLAVGIALVYVFFRLLNLHIILSQAVSLTIVSTAGILITCLMFLYYRRKYGDTGAVPALPRFSFLAYSVTPYFIYGFLYFAFLFMDRVIAWSVNVDSVYLIWFRGPYELGLDLALLTLIIPMGLNEVIIGDFMLNLRASQKEYTGDRTAELNGKYRKMYIKRFVLVLIISFAVSVAIYILIRYIGIDFIIKTGTGLVSNPVTRFVSRWHFLPIRCFQFRS